MCCQEQLGYAAFTRTDVDKWSLPIPLKTLAAVLTFIPVITNLLVPQVTFFCCRTKCGVLNVIPPCLKRVKSKLPEMELLRSRAMLFLKLLRQLEVFRKTPKSTMKCPAKQGHPLIVVTRFLQLP